MSTEAGLKTLYYFLDLANALKQVDIHAVVEAAELILAARREGKNVWIFGNGGSAATASHFANDLLKMGKVRAVSLPDMTPTTLAYMNDVDSSAMFALPLEILWKPGDVLVAISCSGNSKNVLNALGIKRTEPEHIHARSIGLTGDTGGKLAELAAILIRAPHPDIRVQEDVHLAVCHAIAGLVRDAKKP